MGTGTGMLSIGAYFLDAASVTGIDIDMDALNIATENAQNVEADIEFVHIDVLQFENILKKFKNEKKIFDTVVMVKKILKINFEIESSIWNKTKRIRYGIFKNCNRNM
jgi:predicted RNA methylase